jgi:isocitrate dehydrogenase kinase/phosphatase
MSSSLDVIAQQTLARACAADLRDRFADYNTRFRAVTQRARLRFETRDWPGARADAVERIELYDRCVTETTTHLELKLGPRADDKALWAAIRIEYAQLIDPLLDRELYKTFFNTLTRRFFGTRGVDASIEFVALDIEPTDRITHPVARLSYAVSGSLERTFARLLDDYRFAAPYADAADCAHRIADEILHRFPSWGSTPITALEMLQTVFFREQRAYLVGRLFGEGRYSPLVIALVHEDDGLRADAVITETEHVAQIFGYTQSYFQADFETVGDAVVFLRSLLPKKPIDELYTVLGRAKQGKTERYRQFFGHLAEHPDEWLVHADGERGMVMAVFTLPSYPLVFKIIRDRFAFPKQMGRAEVKAKYKLVFKHDRVGRLVDAQEFRFLRFPRAQFAPELLAELVDSCRDSIIEDGADIVVTHCYVERRLRPLNLYVQEAPRDEARRAVLDYGQAIKDLARSNIFPGDLLLKNFGVTRSGRAIFYDYDELCLVTECRFRQLPTARHDDEEMQHETWYHVDDADVFPEQFPRFLGMNDSLREALVTTHGEIFDVRWWLTVQQRVREGGYADLPPYPNRLRLPR